MNDYRRDIAPMSQYTPKLKIVFGNVHIVLLPWKTLLIATELTHARSRFHDIENTGKNIYSIEI